MSWFSRTKGGTEGAHGSSRAPARVLLTNTLTEKKEAFAPLKPGTVLMYTCGPTAYAPVHIGNLRAAWLSEALTRVLQGAGYRVRRVINITDFGHLVTDGDEGEDKMTKGLRSEGLAPTLENMRAMAERYAREFEDDLAQIGMDTNAIDFPRASDFIREDIALIETLHQKGYTYETPSGIYFDTARFAGYGKLGNVRLAEQHEGTRAITSAEKRHPADFVLWKPDPHVGWESPWGRGFPGWHIECSAMIRTLLGQEIDIHTGGEDLEAVHHNNEIAQSEAASGRPFARYWLHNAFLTMGGEKASKSLGNVVYLRDIVERGYHPLSLPYFFLQAHYRTPLSFSWDALEASANALDRLWRLAQEVREESNGKAAPSSARDRFLAFMRDDLATPQALGTLWESLKSDEYTPQEKWGLVEEADRHLGLMLVSPPVRGLTREDVPLDVREMVAKREEARAAKDFALADRLRDQIVSRGYHVDDGPEGPVITRAAK